MEKALERALEFAKGTKYPNRGYYVGPQAYDFWVYMLEEGNEENIDKYGNSVLGIYYFDAKDVAFEYLNRLARKYANSPQGVNLKEASKIHCPLPILRTRK